MSTVALILATMLLVLMGGCVVMAGIGAVRDRL